MHGINFLWPLSILFFTSFWNGKIERKILKTFYFRFISSSTDYKRQKRDPQKIKPIFVFIFDMLQELKDKFSAGYEMLISGWCESFPLL